MKSDVVESASRARVVIHAELCKGCGRCVVACKNEVLAMTTRLNGMGYAVAGEEHPERCTACGLCFYTCPEPGAVSVFGEEQDRDEG